METKDTISLIKARKKVIDVEIESKPDNIKYKFQIRRLTPKEYAKITSGQSRNKLVDDVGTNYVIMESVVCQCTVSPLIVDKPSNECGDSELSINDLSMDILQSLLYEIYVISGIVERTEEDLKN